MIKKNRRHYPRVITHQYLQAAMVEQSQKQTRKQFTPFAWVSAVGVVALMLVGAMSFGQMLLPMQSDAAVAKAESVKAGLQFASSGSSTGMLTVGIR
jgi:hypothetical protein